VLILPNHLAIGALLASNGTFQVPRYQRNYAWRSEEIAAFLKDLDLCRRARADNQRRHHFFGGVVTANSPVPGSSRQNHELIDGQQRLATFLMLLVKLRQAMTSLAGHVGAGGPQPVATFLEQTAKILSERYETHKDTINLTVVSVPRLELSLPDRAFFSALLQGAPEAATRRSHERLRDAFGAMGIYLDDLLASVETPADKAQCLDTVLKVIEEDWTVIHMSAQQKSDAYMLFQVLNDRGLNLTEGELLRASTLEALEPIAPAAEMQAVERCWDNILSGMDLDIQKGLSWVYASQIGDWPGHATLLSDIEQNLFPALSTGAPLTRAQADDITATVKVLERDFGELGTILRGEWPALPHQQIVGWDKDRLRLLVVHLRQTDCLPLLIAATLLAAADFSSIVQMLERFCFRYAVMAEGPRLEAQRVFNTQAVAIRRDPANFSVGDLARDLRDLIARHAPDDVFAARLGGLHYPRSESKKPLKYFLMSLEHYVRWYDEGAQGKPVCRDRMRVLDFDNATIEHIYAENAGQPDLQLTPLIDTLGNLTILSPAENDAAGAKGFTAKRPYLQASTSTLNQQIAAETDWTPQIVRARQERLVKIGLRVFVV